jgi:hypothetical protein
MVLMLLLLVVHGRLLVLRLSSSIVRLLLLGRVRLGLLGWPGLPIIRLLLLLLWSVVVVVVVVIHGLLLRLLLLLLRIHCIRKVRW